MTREVSPAHEAREPVPWATGRDRDPALEARLLLLVLEGPKLRAWSGAAHTHLPQGVPLARRAARAAGINL